MSRDSGSVSRNQGENDKLSKTSLYCLQQELWLGVALEPVLIDSLEKPLKIFFFKKDTSPSVPQLSACSRDDDDDR